MPKVFITGLGFITSIGNDRGTVSRNLRELRHGFELYPPFQKAGHAGEGGGAGQGILTRTRPIAEDWTFPRGTRSSGRLRGHGAERRLRPLRDAAGDGGREARLRPTSPIR